MRKNYHIALLALATASVDCLPSLNTDSINLNAREDGPKKLDSASWTSTKDNIDFNVTIDSSACDGINENSIWGVWDINPGETKDDATSKDLTDWISRYDTGSNIVEAGRNLAYRVEVEVQKAIDELNAFLDATVCPAIPAPSGPPPPPVIIHEDLRRRLLAHDRPDKGLYAMTFLGTVGGGVVGAVWTIFNMLAHNHGHLQPNAAQDITAAAGVAGLVTLLAQILAILRENRRLDRVEALPIVSTAATARRTTRAWRLAGSRVRRRPNRQNAAGTGGNDPANTDAGGATVTIGDANQPACLNAADVGLAALYLGRTGNQNYRWYPSHVQEPDGEKAIELQEIRIDQCPPNPGENLSGPRPGDNPSDRPGEPGPPTTPQTNTGGSGTSNTEGSGDNAAKPADEAESGSGSGKGDDTGSGGAPNGNGNGGGD